MKNMFDCSRSFADFTSFDSLAFISHESTHISFSDIWHRRLGHPSINVVQQGVRLCNSPISLNKILDLCSSCQFGESRKLRFFILHQEFLLFLILYILMFGDLHQYLLILDSNTIFVFLMIIQDMYGFIL